MSRTVARERGFTLVEIMVVLFILGLLIAVAVPSWMSARTRAQARTCSANLRQIAVAKEAYAMANRVAQGESVRMNQLVPDYLQAEPFCPAGGGQSYTVGNIGEPPTCPTGLPNHTVFWEGD